MNLKEEILIAAPPEAVYAALNDPEILRQCIPGCESLTKHSDTQLEAKVSLKIGPVSARFSGDVVLNTEGAPTHFSLTGKGNGGVAGFASGGAEVELAPAEGGTLLKYAASAKVGGRIAQLGSRMIEGTARKLSAQFFATFSRLVAEGQEHEGSGA